MLDRVVEAVAVERFIGTEADSVTMTSREQELGRIRHFILYTLSFDYQTYVNVSLSAADRPHFMQLYGVICNLYIASKRSAVLPIKDERRALAPYFLRCLHEPCRTFGITVEYLVTVIARFTKYNLFISSPQRLPPPSHLPAILSLLPARRTASQAPHACSLSFGPRLTWSRSR